MKRAVPFFLLLGVFIVGAVVWGQESPQQTLAGLKPAEGLQTTLFASEPMITNPTDLTVDERGRVWVLEGQNYRRKARNQPDLRPAGDRIMILEDTNNDGKADNAKVFDQNPDIRVPLGIAVLGNKVYVSQSPDIIVYTKDDNDKILKKEVLLTGFNGIDHDHGLHAVVFGWDGKYYFNQGNTGFDVTDTSGKRQYMQAPATGGMGGGASNAPAPPTPPTGPGYFQGVVFRMNPDGSNLEVLGQNFRNPYEVAVDSWGNVWQTDNDDDGYAWTRFMYNMEGGNYGYRGPLNKTWSEDHGTHWHQEVPGVSPLLYRIGAGAPCGLLIYEGTLLPAKYRGQPLHADAGKRKVAMYALEERGAGYEARSEDVLNMGDDTWARPVDVAAAPDGALFIGDWYDPGVGGHLMGDPEGARGRVYRLAPTGNKPVVPALNLTTDAGLSAALASPNQSRQYLAYTAIKAKGAAAVPMLQAAWKQSDPIVKARALWMLGGLGDAGKAAIQEAMKSTDPRFRVLGLRVARSNGADMLTFSKPFLRDSSPAVRREIALMLQDHSKMLPPYAAPDQTPASPELIDALATLASQYDGQDRWYLEALGIAARGREDALYAKLKSGANLQAGVLGKVVWETRPKTAVPDLIATINNTGASSADRMMALDALGNMQWPEAARALETFIVASATPAPLAEHAFELYSHQLFSLWTDARTSPGMPAVVRKAFTLAGAQAAAATLAADLNDPQFLPDLVAFAKSSSGTPEGRAAAIEAVSTMKGADYVADFQSLGESGPAPVRAAAIRALAAANAPGLVDYAQKIVVSDAPNEVRTEAMRALSASAAGLNAILDMAEKGTLPMELKTVATNLTNNATPPVPAGRGGRRGGPPSPVTIRQRGAAPTDPAYIAIRERAAKLLPATAARKIPTSFEIDLSYAGKAADGRKVFDTDAGCAACHSLGGPTKLGPDLSHIGTKYGKQALLDNIIHPSEGISPEYVPTTFTLKNGDQVAGLVAEERPDQITVQLGPNQQQRIKPSDVATRKEIRVSLMPEGLLNNLSLQQIADLLEFLASQK
jgi:putative membrane-bound dehydrogenase-like protein